MLTRLPHLIRPLGATALALALAGSLAACSGDSDDSPFGSDPAASATPSPQETTEPAPDPTAATATGSATPEAGGTCTWNEAGEAAKPVETPGTQVTVSGTPQVSLATNKGDITLTLDAAGTPCTVQSFVSLVEQKYFDDTTCHRVTSGDALSVLQCGDPTALGSGGPGYEMADELETAEALEDSANYPGAKVYPAGTVAMANAGPNTGGSQFFLVYQDSHLPPGYAVFGTMDEASTKVVAAIGAAGDKTGAGDGPPVETVTISTATLS